jgi:hypothetical protein
MNRMPAVVEMNVAEGPEAEGARRATGASGSSATLRAPTPDPEVPSNVSSDSSCTYCPRASSASASLDFSRIDAAPTISHAVDERLRPACLPHSRHPASNRSRQQRHGPVHAAAGRW